MIVGTPILKMLNIAKGYFTFCSYVIVKYMDILNTINAIVVSIGIPTIIVVAIYIGRKLQILDDLQPLRDKFAIVESRVGDLWADRTASAHSPRQLNDKGRAILTGSGIKEVIEEKKNDLFAKVKETNPSNTYDAEKVILDVVSKIPEYYPELVAKLKDGAFKTGNDLDTVFLVGGIYLRNLIIGDLGFKINDIDNAKNSIQG